MSIVLTWFITWVNSFRMSLWSQSLVSSLFQYKINLVNHGHIIASQRASVFDLSQWETRSCYYGTVLFKCGSQDSVTVSQNTGALKLKQLNGIWPLLIIWITHVLFPLWHDKMSSVQKACQSLINYSTDFYIKHNQGLDTKQLLITDGLMMLGGIPSTTFKFNLT